MSVNKVILVGRLGKDAETKFTTGGASVTNFSIATDRKWKDKASGEWKKETEWHNITAWSIEGLAPYLTKGKQVYVEGRMQTRSYEKDGEKRYSTGVVSETITLLGGGEKVEADPPFNAGTGKKGGKAKSLEVEYDDLGSVPF